MTSCSVKHCKNNVAKKTPISFFSFPTSPSLKRQWVEAMSRNADWIPRKSSRVCSIHFEDSSYYVTYSGLRRLHSHAVPTKNLSIPIYINTCRICLATEIKMFRMQEHSLQTMYEQLTGLSVTSVNWLPEHLCWECAHRLVCCESLRTKALRSHGLMMEILNTAGRLTPNSLKQIDRQSNELSSSLTNEVIYKIHIQDESPLKLDDKNVCKIEEDDFQEAHENFQEAEENFQEVIENFQEVNVNFQDVNENFQYERGSDVEMKMDLDLEIMKEDAVSTNDADNFVGEDKSSSSSNHVLAKKREKIKETKVRRKRRPRNKVAMPKIDRRLKPVDEAVNLKLFTVKNLTVKEQIAAMKKRQEAARNKNSPYRCSDCYRAFPSEESYNNHLNLHTDQAGTYVCQICKMHWKSQSKLNHHMVGHSQRISCNFCPFATSARHSANYHEKFHNGTKYQCPHCEENFTQWTTYMNHVRIKHAGFVCGLCGGSFVGDRGLYMHMQRKHRFDDQTIPEDGPYCKPCEVRFASDQAMDTHLKLAARHNTGVSVSRRKNTQKKEKGQFKIDMDKGTKEPQSTGIILKWRKPLGIIKVAKEDGPPVPCELCDAQLSSSKAYYHHFRREHPDRNRTSFPSMKTPYMCEVCGKLFANIAHLNDHSTTHSDSVQFKCEQCGKTFRSRYRLMFHTRGHEVKRPTHPCGECGKHFSTFGNLQKHRLIHTGVKPFKCEMCGKCFKQPSEKRQHVSYVHLKKPWPKRNRVKRTRERQNKQVSPERTTEDMDTAPLWPAKDPI